MINWEAVEASATLSGLFGAVVGLVLRPIRADLKRHAELHRVHFEREDEYSKNMAKITETLAGLDRLAQERHEDHEKRLDRNDDERATIRAEISQMRGRINPS